MPKLIKDMTEPELSAHIASQLRFIKSRQTPDTIGSMLIVFCDNGISQYGATIDPAAAPEALRELADRIERRETVKRQHASIGCAHSECHDNATALGDVCGVGVLPMCERHATSAGVIRLREIRPEDLER